jgi:hypothetical protein
VTTTSSRPLGSAAVDVGRQLASARDEPAGLAEPRVDPARRIARAPRRVGLAFIELAAIGRVGEPDAAVGVRDSIVRRIEALAVEGVGDHRDRAVVLIADDASRQMLAGDLPALEIKSVAVAVVGRGAENADLSVVVEPAQLAIVRDVAPHDITTLAAPGRALCPQRTRPQALDRRVALHIFREQRIDDDDVGVEPIDVGRRVGSELARRAGDDGGRHPLFRLRQHLARPGDRRTGGECCDQAPARQAGAAVFVACHSSSP